MWVDKTAYDAQAKRVAGLFVANFEKFADKVNADVRAAGF
jgi:phosphoenolpyruvate carboxykinase (ATP)